MDVFGDVSQIVLPGRRNTFKNMRCIFRGRGSTLDVSSSMFRGRGSTSDVACCVFFTNRIGTAARRGDKVASVAFREM